jgi:hypothetical protein
MGIVRLVDAFLTGADWLAIIGFLEDLGITPRITAKYSAESVILCGMELSKNKFLKPIDILTYK